MVLSFVDLRYTQTELWIVIFPILIFPMLLVSAISYIECLITPFTGLFINGTVLYLVLILNN